MEETESGPNSRLSGESGQPVEEAAVSVMMKAMLVITLAAWAYDADTCAAAGINTPQARPAHTENGQTDKEGIKAKPGDDAFFDVGLTLSSGDGLPQDYVQAYKWFNLSAVRGNKEAETMMAAIASHMTPEQLENARNSIDSAAVPFCFFGRCVTAKQIEQANLAEARNFLALREATKREEAVCARFTNPLERNACLVYGPELGPDVVRGSILGDSNFVN